VGGLRFEVATISRLLKMIGLFCRILSLFKGSFAKETCNCMEATALSLPIPLRSRLLKMIGLFCRISSLL